jgi:GAF domain-containing protein
VNPDLAHSGDDAAALAAILARFNCQAGTIHRMVDGLLQLTAAHNLPPPVVELVRTVPVGKGMAGLAAQTRTPVSLCNLQTDTSGHARPAAKTSGMEGSIAVPMLAGDEVWGVLGIAKAVAHDWSDEEKTSLLALAARLAVARA